MLLTTHHCRPRVQAFSTRLHIPEDKPCFPGSLQDCKWHSSKAFWIQQHFLSIYSVLTVKLRKTHVEDTLLIPAFPPQPLVQHSRWVWLAFCQAELNWFYHPHEVQSFKKGTVLIKFVWVFRHLMEKPKQPVANPIEPTIGKWLWPLLLRMSMVDDQVLGSQSLENTKSHNLCHRCQISVIFQFALKFCNWPHQDP